MRRVVKTDEVAHMWANQTQEEARNPGGNFYFRGATIYSYGSHFPIATLLNDGNVLFTTRKYSNTTAKHVSMARGACSHKSVIYVNEVPVVYGEEATKKNCNQIGCNEKNVSHWLGVIDLFISEINNPKNRNIAGRVQAIDNELQEMNSFLTYFGEKSILKRMSSELTKRYRKTIKLVSVSRPKWEARIEEAAQRELNRVGLTDEQREANRVKREEKMRKDWETYFSLWQSCNDAALTELPQSVKKNAANYIRAGRNSRRSSMDSLRWGFVDQNYHTRLRYNAEKKRVETSKGIEIPEEIAKRTWLKIKGCTNCEGLEIDVVGYTLTEANTKFIKAGCHTIPQSDVQYIAQLLNWN